MQGETISPFLSDALVILGAAGIVIPLFARFRVTPVIGFILVGILVGPFGLGRLVAGTPWLTWVTITNPQELAPFAEFGIVLLLFTIGLELSFRRLWTMRRLVFGLGALELAANGVLLAGALVLMGHRGPSALGLGVALALSSTALVLPIAGTRTPVGRVTLAMLLFEDIALVPIVFVLGAFAPAGGSGWQAMLQPIWQGVLVVIAMMAIGRFTLPLLFGQAARTKSPELFLAASLLVVIVAGLATSLVGLSPIVGALVAGVLIAETDYHAEVQAIIEPFKGLALGVFLITIGMSIDLGIVWGRLGEIAFAVVVVLVLKAVITGVLLRVAGNRRSTATEASILLASPSETTLIVLGAATAARLIAPATAQFWEIVTAIGMTVTPLLARAGPLVARRIESAPAEPQQDPETPRVLIVGCGRVGRLVADMLARHGRAYVALDADADMIVQCKREGYNAVFGNAARLDVLERLGLARAPAVVLTMDQSVLAKRLTQKLRAAYPDVPIIARARDSDHAAELYKAGASTAVPETLEASLQLSEAVLVDLGVAMGPVIASIHEKRDEFRETIREGAALEHKPQLRTSIRPV